MKASVLSLAGLVLAVTALPQQIAFNAEQSSVDSLFSSGLELASDGLAMAEALVHKVETEALELARKKLQHLPVETEGCSLLFRIRGFAS